MEVSIEETSSASQSMKEQAQELMRQVEGFKTNQTEGQHTTHASVKRAAQSVAAKPSAHANGPKPGLKKPAASAKLSEAKELVTVRASNGKDRRQKDSECEDFQKP